MAHILTISGQRGGIGKTLTAVNLACGLALYEKKTLLVDCDPRAVGTQWMNLSESRHSLASFFSGKSSFSSAVVATELSHLDMIPAGFELFFASLNLSKLTANELILKTALRFGLSANYEYIIIDSPSSWGYLPIVAHAAADFLISPVHPEITSKQDFECLFQMLGYIKKTHETTVKIAGFLPNFCDSVSQISHCSWYEYFQDLQDLVFHTAIPKGKRLPMILTDVKDKAANAYLAYTRELISVFEINHEIEEIS